MGLDRGVTGGALEGAVVERKDRAVFTLIIHLPPAFRAAPFGIIGKRKNVRRIIWLRNRERCKPLLSDRYISSYQRSGKRE
jgi:hypothetical protein